MRSFIEVTLDSNTLVTVDDQAFRLEFARKIAGGYSYHVDRQTLDAWFPFAFLYIRDSGRELELLDEPAERHDYVNQLQLAALEVGARLLMMKHPELAWERPTSRPEC